MKSTSSTISPPGVWPILSRSAANPLFHFVNDTILNRDAMLELMGICDVVAHLAAAVGVKLIIDEPLKSIHTNIVGTEIVLELANKFRKKIFLASTSEVYGQKFSGAAVRKTIFGFMGRLNLLAGAMRPLKPWMNSWLSPTTGQSSFRSSSLDSSIPSGPGRPGNMGWLFRGL